MTRLVAFLRGINLGDRRLKMDRLRECFEELEVRDVATFLASGNVVFGHDGTLDREALEGEIEEHLQVSLGYPVATFLRSMEELVRLLESEAVSAAAAEEELNPQMVFLRSEAGPEVRRALAALATDEDGFELLGREVLWLRRGRLSDATITVRELEAALGGPEHTTRTLNTVRRIVGKFGE